MQRSVNNSLVQYIEHEILPRYEHYDAAHQRDHIDAVILRSLELAKHYDVNVDMVYAIAAYHDTGICEGRETHHLVSGRIIREDKRLHDWFDEQQIETIAQAAEDHRASSTHEPRSIYGKIVAEADRLIVPETVIKRTIQYGLDHYPDYDKEGQYQRFKEHMTEKYSDRGYLRLWLPESDNATRLEELRKIIRDENKLRQTFEKEYDKLRDMEL
ncbi:MAG: HD domain-containing protein [Bacteroidales bacterium]|nr:HD domain-containing protein [Bacteroidales bacterium]MBR0540568.1 HD domain-containing protein [Bacteroidales bacterium]